MTTDSDPATKTDDGRRFRVTLASVLFVQIVALLLLGWMQHHFSH